MKKKGKEANEWLSNIKKLIQRKDKNIEFKSDILGGADIKSKFSF